MYVFPLGGRTLYDGGIRECEKLCESLCERSCAFGRCDFSEEHAHPLPLEGERRQRIVLAVRGWLESHYKQISIPDRPLGAPEGPQLDF